MIKRSPLLLLVFGFLACSAGGDADRRVAKYFDIPVEHSPSAIRQQLLRKFPPGTAADRIYSAISQGGIGRDGVSSFYPADKNNVVVVRSGFRGPTVVATHYGIFFKLDARRRLNDITVQQWFTGP